MLGEEGVREMQIGVYKLLVFAAGRANTARIIGLFVFATQILRVSDSQSQAARTFGAQKQLRMANPVIAHRVNQALFYIVLANYGTKLHWCKILN